jgi:hypothetical protein
MQNESQATYCCIDDWDDDHDDDNYDDEDNDGGDNDDYYICTITLRIFVVPTCSVW